MMADTSEPEVTTLRLIPPPALRLTRKAALRWLTKDAGDWVRVLSVSEASNTDTCEALGMLAMDVSMLVDACAYVVASGKAATIAQDGNRLERRDVEHELACIVAARPSAVDGGFVTCFEILAQRLVELLAEREAA